MLPVDTAEEIFIFSTNIIHRKQQQHAILCDCKNALCFFSEEIYVLFFAEEISPLRFVQYIW